MEQAHLSPAAHQRLTEELAYLSGPAKLELADTIETARELGDLKENADYHAAKDKQGLNQARIRQLEATLKQAVVVEESTTDRVRPFTVIEIRYAGDDEIETYLFGHSAEQPSLYGLSDDQLLTYTSPLGAALLDQAVGAEVPYDTPKGKTLTVEVVAIRLPAEA
jgi:transcription elongation factor GreA